MTELDRITRFPEIMGGKPTLRGLRVTVGTVVGLVTTGSSFADILTAYPYLEKEDIEQALLYEALNEDAWSRANRAAFLAGYCEADAAYDTLD